MITFFCGILSGGVFCVMADNTGGGLLSMFMPVLPLAIIGFFLSSRNAVVSAFIACAVISGIAGIESMLFFAVFLAFPMCHFVRKSLLWRYRGDFREFYPVLAIITELAAMAAGIFMVFGLAAGYSEHNSLQAIISSALVSQIDGQASAKDPNLAHLMKIIVTDWVFMIFACAAWFWVMCIYSFAVIANMLLKSKNLALRPSLAISQEGLPVWLPVIIAVSAGLAVFGHGNDKFAGEAVFMIMILPYFLCGIAVVNKMSVVWRNRGVWLGVFYVAVIFIPWAPVLLVARGVYTQVEALLKHKAQDGND